MIRTYINRYLEGESTQEELRLMREYFRSTTDLPSDLAPLARMFALLDEKQPTPSAEALDRFSAEQAPVRRRTPWWSLLAAAACIAAVCFFLLVPSVAERNVAIAYVDGKRLNDERVAMQMSREALQEIFSMGNQEEQLTQIFNTP